ncbi:MAG: hypothetical protein KF761_10655 [Salinibacterium sp.]|nr:hypothetical protein [Salinibacterium sp.]
MSADDVLLGAAWECARDVDHRANDDIDDLDWAPAPVPGTVASALAARGVAWESANIDDHIWWYRATFSAPHADGLLSLDGLAGAAEVWVNGQLVSAASDMFTSSQVNLSALTAQNDVVIRFASIASQLGVRRSRPRWRVARLVHQNLRWLRTSLWGRLRGAVPVPAPVGPWRPVRVHTDGPTVVRRRILSTTGPAETGQIIVDAHLWSAAPPSEVELHCDGQSVAATVAADADGFWHLTARLDLPAVRRWWPQAGGEQPLYEVTLDVDGTAVALGRTGFREIEVDTSDGGHRFVVNGVPLFVGGACWMPVDPIGLQNDPAALRAALDLVVGAHMSMLRVTGDTVFESDEFYDLCDELGILVWQDCMLAFADPPTDDAWTASVVAETRQQLERLSGHPCLALVSGGSEIAQQATYAGISLDQGLPLLTSTLPAVVNDVLPGMAYLPTSPWGGDIPTRPDTGVSHYYGVGGYLRGVDDARRASPRFAAECLAFAVPPSRLTVDETFGDAHAAGHTPEWKRAVFRDGGSSWDFEDVRDHYVRELFGCDPTAVRYYDPERYLDLGRATVSVLYERVFGEWRRSAAPSAGGLAFYLRDSLPGAGMGLIDALGRPKASWYALRRVLAPLALTLSDEGLNGLIAHIHNDSPAALEASLEVELFIDGELRVDAANCAITLPARSSTQVTIDSLFDGFRDLTWSHRFGPLTYDVIGVRLVDSSGESLSEAVHLPGGLARPSRRDIGLAAVIETVDDLSANLILSTREFAQFVTVESTGWTAEDSGFDLVGGRGRVVRLTRSVSGGAPIGDPSSVAIYTLNGASVVTRPI